LPVVARPGIAAIQPQLILALGVTAANALSGKSIVLSRLRGRRLELPDGRHVMVTTHPSAILRLPDEASRRKARAALVEDIKAAMKAAK
jgi:DNA polymerase